MERYGKGSVRCGVATPKDHIGNIVLMTPPSAEAVQGAWIDVENEPYCECSVCGAYIDNLDDNYAFCPRCGADMRGEEE